MSFEMMWKREIEIVQRILGDEYDEPYVNFRGVSVKVIKELFGKGDKVES